MTPIKITNLQEALSLIEKFKAKDTLSNCFLLTHDIEIIVNKGLLWYANDDTNAFLFEDKGNCYRIHYMINNIDIDFNPIMDKPLILEILYRGNDGVPRGVLRYWEKQGFNENLVRMNLAAKFTDISMSSPCNISMHVIKTPEEGELARTLFNKSFDPYSGDYITEEQSSELVKNQQIIIAESESNFAGALHFYNIGRCAWIGHVAVCPDIRGRGFGNALVSEFIRLNHTDDKSRYALWVQAQNKPAVDMYQRFGFKYAGKSSLSMIKELI